LASGKPENTRFFVIHEKKMVEKKVKKKLAKEKGMFYYIYCRLALGTEEC